MSVYVEQICLICGLVTKHDPPLSEEELSGQCVNGCHDGEET